MKRLLARLLLDPGDRVIRIKSWRPNLGPYGIEWPCLLVDDKLGHRRTIWPVWDRVRWRELLRGRG